MSLRKRVDNLERQFRERVDNLERQFRESECLLQSRVSRLEDASANQRPRKCAVCGHLGLTDDMVHTFDDSIELVHPVHVHKYCMPGSEFDRRKED